MYTFIYLSGLGFEFEYRPKVYILYIYMITIILYETGTKWKINRSYCFFEEHWPTAVTWAQQWQNRKLTFAQWIAIKSSKQIWFSHSLSTSTFNWIELLAFDSFRCCFHKFICWYWFAIFQKAVWFCYIDKQYENSMLNFLCKNSMNHTIISIILFELLFSPRFNRPTEEESER